ncbi:hypothetical protein OPT61_g184 [Boeremia exigua]|uniref:Uncharacterized protein n=1 Tax=Boeremia exigua TaxID=749465 RepID=A0ACC2IUN6_9PLEO|nr:hypothetical protein OPT61_g184 [Boeremia exigua]
MITGRTHNKALRFRQIRMDTVNLTYNTHPLRTSYLYYSQSSEFPTLPLIQKRVSLRQQHVPKPPKAQASTTRRGRIAKAAAPKSATMAPPSSPKKRGRPAKTTASEVATVEPPKKRGRPAKSQGDEPVAQIESAIKRGRRSIAAAEEVVAEAPAPTKQRAGRSTKATDAVAAEAAAPKKRGGRPRKDDVTTEAAAPSKRRGRPTLDLNRVAGSSRVGKRSSPRSKPAARPTRKVAAAPRANPVEKAKTNVAQPAKKARGRPKEVGIEVNASAPKKTSTPKKASAPKKASGRGRKASAPVPFTLPKKVTARPKTAVPRKRRGYTSFEVADKFAAQVKQLIADLLAEDAANAAAAAGEADDEGEEVEVEVELGSEDAIAGPSDNPLEEEEAAIESADEGDHVQTLLDEERPVQGEDIAADDEFDDETELPSETAVLAEIAAVQDELDVQDAIQDDVQMAGVPEPDLERQGSSSSVSIDLHEEITEVTSTPQIDGSNEVDVFHAHVDEHLHEHVHVPEPAAVMTAGSIFGTLLSDAPEYHAILLSPVYASGTSALRGCPKACNVVATCERQVGHQSTPTPKEAWSWSIYDADCNVVDALTYTGNPCDSGTFSCTPAPITFNRYVNTFSELSYTCRPDGRAGKCGGAEISVYCRNDGDKVPTSFKA